MSEKKILFLTPQMIVGGAEKYILQKSEWLIKNGYKVVIGSSGGEWQEEFNKLGGKHYKIDFINEDPYLLKRSEFLTYIRFIEKIIECENIEIIEANQLNPAIWGYYISNMYQVPFIMNVLAGQVFNEGKYNYIKFLKHIDDLGLYYNSECSNGIIEEKKNVKLSNCVEIPIPISDLKFNCGKNINSNYILTVCRMEPEKMYLKSLIREFYKLVSNNHYEDLRLIIVGEGTKFLEIKKLVDKVNKKLADKTSKIELKGTVVGDSLNTIYANCLLYVGMGTTVIQAAQHKKSVILATPDKKHMKYSTGFFGEDNYNSIGFKFKEMKLDSFYNRMMLIINNQNKRELLEEKSYQIYNEVFETEIVMKRWISEYKKNIDEYKTNDNTFFQENELFCYLKKLKHKLFWPLKRGINN